MHHAGTNAPQVVTASGTTDTAAASAAAAAAEAGAAASASASGDSGGSGNRTGGGEAVAAALSMLRAQSVAPAQNDVMQEEGIQMVAVGGSAALPGASGGHVRGVRPFSASSVPLTTLDGHRSNPLLRSVLAQHDKLTEIPEVRTPFYNPCVCKTVCMKRRI